MFHCFVLLHRHARKLQVRVRVRQRMIQAKEMCVFRMFYLGVQWEGAGGGYRHGDPSPG